MSVINDFELLTNMIQKAARLERTFRYSVPRIGQVKKVEDENEVGRILVTCDSLGWYNEDQGVWAYPKDNRRLVTPKIDDYVIIEWIDGNRDSPVLYTGIAYFMKNMLPKNYDGKPKTQVIFEDNDQEFSVVYDEENKKLKIIHEKKEWSLEWDENLLKIIDKEGQYFSLDAENKKIELITKNCTGLLDSDNKKTEWTAGDVNAIMDGNAKTIELNDSGNSYKSDEAAGSIILENKSGKKAELTASSILLTGASGSFEVL